MERHNGIEFDPEGAFVYYDDAQRALDAERADNAMAREAYWATIADLRSELATLQAQLRQAEGERDDYRLMYMSLTGESYDNPLSQARAELTTLRQLVSALPVVDVQEVSVWLSPDESGWLVSKRPAFPAGLYWAKFRTQAEADSFRALLAYRATLAAKDARKAVSSG